MTNRKTNDVRLTVLEQGMATLAQGIEALLAHAAGTPKPTVAVTVRKPAPPLPVRPLAVGKVVAVSSRPAVAPRPWPPVVTQPAQPVAARTVAQAHREHETCFLGCRAARGQASKPGLGLIEVATGDYFATGEGRNGALTAHAAAGTTWSAVMEHGTAGVEVTGQDGRQCVVSAQAIVEELARLRTSGENGNRGVPSILTGESAISGARLSPAPFRRATMPERLALDDTAYQACASVLLEAQALRQASGRAL
jgi:hypothetical protein